MSKSIDFKEIKTLIIESEDLESIITELKYSEKALFLYWALDSLEEESYKFNHEKNAIFLKNIQKQVCEETDLESSLQKYSPGFILGLLEFTIRSIEANIEKYEQYLHLVSMLKSWKELGFPDENFEKHYEQTMHGIHEIDDWHEMKTEEYFPIMSQLINSSRYKRSKNQVLKFLSKRCRKDTTVFFLLSGFLRTNPKFHLKVEKYCKDNDVSFEDLNNKLSDVLVLLRQETDDKKVKNYIDLFLRKKPTINFKEK